MPEAKLEVRLLTGTPNAMSLIYAAFRQCYSPGFAGDLWSGLIRGEIGHADQAGFIAKVLESGHDSPLEHVSYSFAVQGISRALTHQLVRHRIASYSQQSQRYVDESATLNMSCPRPLPGYLRPGKNSRNSWRRSAGLTGI